MDPLYRTVPEAAGRDAVLDELLALSDLDAALAIDPLTRTPPSERADVRDRRATARRHLGDALAALADWADALRVCPATPSRSTTALARADAGDTAAALADVRAALAADPLDAVVHLTHAEILAAAGQPDAALDALRTALGLDPEMALYLGAPVFDPLRTDPRFASL